MNTKNHLFGFLLIISLFINIRIGVAQDPCYRENYDDAVVRLNEGKGFLQSKQYDQAIASFNQAIKIFGLAKTCGDKKQVAGNDADSDLASKIKECKEGKNKAQQGIDTPAPVAPVTTLSVSPTNLSFDASGGTITVTVSTNADSWAVRSTENWCKVTKSGSTLTVVCDQNTSATKREGRYIQVSAGDKTSGIYISQSGRAVVATTLSVSSTNLSFGASGGTATVTVTTNADSWTANSTENWCKVTKSGLILTVVCDQNTNATKREGYYITVAAGNRTSSVYVSQSGKAIADKDRIEITDVKFGYKMNDTVRYGLTLYNDITYLYPKIVYNNLVAEAKKFTVNVKIYDADGTLMRGSDSPEGYIYSQEISPLGSNKQGDSDGLKGWGSQGGTSYQTPGTYYFELWIDDELKKRKSFVITERRTTRQTTTTTTTGTATRQETSLSVGESGIAFDYSGGTKYVSITTNTDSYEILFVPSWLTVTKTSSGISIKCNYYYNENISREESFTIKANDKKEIIIVKQFPSPPVVPSEPVVRTGRQYAMGLYKRHQAGFSASFVQKNWTARDIETGETSTYGYWSDKSVPGIQAGFHWDFFFAPKVFGLGFRTGLFYEFYTQTSDVITADDVDFTYKANFTEHVINFPFHLIYRYDITKKFGLFINAGIAIDYGFKAKIKATYEGENDPFFTTDDIYDNEEWGNLSTPSVYYEYGGGIQYRHLMLNFSVSKGVDDKSNISGFELFQNKAIKVGLVIPF